MVARVFAPESGDVEWVKSVSLWRTRSPIAYSSRIFMSHSQSLCPWIWRSWMWTWWRTHSQGTSSRLILQSVLYWVWTSWMSWECDCCGEDNVTPHCPHIWESTYSRMRHILKALWLHQTSSRHCDSTRHPQGTFSRHYTSLLQNIVSFTGLFCRI